MPSDALPDDLQTLKAMLLAEQCESERLRQIIKEMQRHRFGRRAETLPEDQMLLGLEDVEQTAASDAAIADQSAPTERAARAGKRRTNRGSLPAHLPRVEIVVDIDNRTCPCCQGELHRIGEDKSERLDIVPAQFRVLVTRRPKYACRRCADGVVQAPVPARLIEGGMPTEATIAQVLVSKYADHLPLYRQAQIYVRQGIELATLADWVGQAAWHLRPLQERLLVRLKQRPRLFADETTAPVLAAPRPVSFGPMPLTTGHGAAVTHLASSISTHPIANLNGQLPIWRASKALTSSCDRPRQTSIGDTFPVYAGSAGKVENLGFFRKVHGNGIEAGDETNLVRGPGVGWEDRFRRK